MKDRSEKNVPISDLRASRRRVVSWSATSRKSLTSARRCVTRYLHDQPSVSFADTCANSATTYFFANWKGKGKSRGRGKEGERE